MIVAGLLFWAIGATLIVGLLAWLRSRELEQYEQEIDEHEADTGEMQDALRGKMIEVEVDLWNHWAVVGDRVELEPGKYTMIACRHDEPEAEASVAEVIH